MVFNSAEFLAGSGYRLNEMGFEGEDVAFCREDPLGVIGMKGVVLVK